MVRVNTRYEKKPTASATMFAAIYTRVSDTNEDNTEVSHEFQEVSCRARAEALGYTVVEVFKDNFSGRFLHERPGLSRLREGVRDRRFQAVFVWKMDRFSRRLAQRAICVQELRDHDCQCISATEDIADSPEGRLLESILGAIAEFEVERTLERSQAGISIIKKRGLPICQGVARYGYRYDTETRTRVIVEEEATVVRQIFEWCVGGDCFNMIATRLTRLGIPAPAQARGIRRKKGYLPGWHPSTVRLLLQDESYAGAPMVSGKKRSTGEIDKKGRARSEKTESSEWWTGKHATPAIIDKATFASARDMIAKHRTGRSPHNNKHEHLLRGMVECAKCGRSMSPCKTSNGRKWYWYFTCISRQLGCNCGNPATPMAWLDEAVWAEVAKVLTDRRVVDQRFAELMKENRTDDMERDRDAHNAEVSKARDAIRRLMVRLESSDDPEIIGPLEERLAELRAKIAAHQGEIKQIESKLFVAQNQAAALERWAAACAHGRDKIVGGRMPLDQKRDLLRALRVRVVANKKVVTLSMGVQLVNTADHPGTEHPAYQHSLDFAFVLQGKARQGVKA